MLERCSSDAICLQANDMLDSTIVSSVSVYPACSCFSSHVVRFSISYLFFFTLPAAAGGGCGGAVPMLTALQRVRGAAATAAGLWRRWEGERRAMEWEAEVKL